MRARMYVCTENHSHPSTHGYAHTHIHKCNRKTDENKCEVNGKAKSDFIQIHTHEYNHNYHRHTAYTQQLANQPVSQPPKQQQRVCSSTVCSALQCEKARRRNEKIDTHTHIDEHLHTRARWHIGESIKKCARKSERKKDRGNFLLYAARHIHERFSLGCGLRCVRVCVVK